MEDGAALLKEAERAAQPGRSWLLFSQAPDWDAALSLYERAANAFKAAQDWPAAADAFARAADVAKQGDEPVQYTKMLLASAGALQHVDASAAVAAMDTAVGEFLRRGRFDTAAGIERDIAALYDDALGDAASAMRYYQRAAERYRGENHVAMAQACRLKVAALAAQVGEYAQAAEIYEAAALAAVADPHGQYTVRNNLLCAGLCRVAAGDRVAARRALEGYAGAVYGAFSGTLEQKFLEEVLAAADGGDADALSGAVQRFSQRSNVDVWKMRVISAIRTSLSAVQASDLM